MEHIVQFGIGIDDGAIVKSVAEHAEKIITADIKKQVESEIFNCGGYYSRGKELSEVGCEIVEKWLESHKDEVIDKAADKIAERVYRSKAWKNKYGEVTAE